MDQSDTREARPKARRPLELDAATKRLAARLWRDWARPHRRKLIVATALMFVVAGATSLYPLMIDRSYEMFTARNAAVIYLMPIAVLIVTTTKGLSFYGQTVLVNWIALRIVADMQNAMFARLVGADLARIQSEKTGNLISRFTNDTRLVQDALVRAFNNLVRDVLTVVCLVGAMIYLDWVLSLFALVVYPFAAMPIVRIGRRLRRVSKNAQVQIGGITSLLNESFSGARMVKTYGLEDYERERASAEFESRFQLLMRMVRSRTWIEPIVEVLGGLAVAGILALVGWRLMNGNDTLGEFTGFVTALVIASQPVRAIGTLNAVLQEGLAAVQRVFVLLDEAPSIVERPNAPALAVERGEIMLDDVWFSYGDGIPALSGVTIEVKPTTTVALVGPSGAGKSTVFNLIPRLYDPAAGRVTIDNCDIREVSLASLRSAVAVVSQDVVLFNDTVAANIGFGRLGAGQAEIVAAAKAAAADQFVTELAQGYDTLVGDRGVRLSGGERQRIALARAILKDAPILLLDEATSALDSQSEQMVQAALDELRRGRTTLVIAHRLSTVRDADRIYVLDDGRVRETGDHDSLMRADGLFARLARLQFRPEREADKVAATRA